MKKIRLRICGCEVVGDTENCSWVVRRIGKRFRSDALDAAVSLEAMTTLQF